ncbi:hypothetical protein TRFO_39531 [Tritrichomonas foetus]|uniref:Uncharacterized protein n=1 Tax=Tritrichomonas foetus TaxID=1144522 RepID=A0A1J4J4H1_9EUKA|nr:hypothetical protein TRFO_39531 [Tritrichomonas foetus]|eukprot:OHS94264.1 hypothetical protein TRFO_39531 [Tritrichomonas foetus]
MLTFSKIHSISMEFPIQLALSHENWFSTFLTIHQKGKNIYFNYGNPKEDPLFSDSFYSYKYIDIDDNESSMISFHGISHRIIIFENKYAVSNIWLYLQKFVDFISVPDKKQRFSINEKDCSLPEKNYLTESAQNSNLLKKNIDLDLEDPLTWNFDPTVNFDFARSSSVTFISLPFTEVNIDNIDEYFDKETKIIKTNRLFSTINIDNKGYANIFWDSLIGKIDEIFFNEYQKLRNQWVLTSENQWNNDSSIRKFVSTLEAKLDSLEIQAHILRQVMFDSLMSCVFFYSSFLMELLFQHSNT